MDHGLPGWFRAVFCVVMLSVCGLTAYSACAQYRLRCEIAEASASLDTSRQRELKQQYEYDEVSAALPRVQSELAALEPQAEQAAAAAADLKARRKELRAERDALSASAASLGKDLSALEDKLTALLAQTRSLASAVDAVR